MRNPQSRVSKLVISETKEGNMGFKGTQKLFMCINIEFVTVLTMKAPEFLSHLSWFQKDLEFYSLIRKEMSPWVYGGGMNNIWVKNGIMLIGREDPFSISAETRVHW